jgi:hypothetical protein
LQISPIENKVQIVTQHQKLVNTEEDQKTGLTFFKIDLEQSSKSEDKGSKNVSEVYNVCNTIK